MKIFQFFILSIFLMSSANSVWAASGVLATSEDVMRLKNDLRSGKVKVGKSRLKSVRQIYGDAPTITEDAKRVIYEYEDLKIEFTKKQYWREWSFDGFKKRAYTPEIDQLRLDLQSDVLVGENITFDAIKREYDEPTESVQATEDGQKSYHYYGDIKLIFENMYTLKKWKGKNLATEPDSGVLGGK